MELGQSKATRKRVTKGSQINSTTLLATHGPSVVLGSPHSPSPAPAPQEQAGQHLLLFWDPLYSTQRVGVADVAGQRLHQGVPNV